MLFFIVIIAAEACASPLPNKMRPDYKGVDPKIQPYVNEYMWLSTQFHIKFDDKVTIGFTKIDHGNVVGVCYYGGFFREIDIDSDYWEHSTTTTRMTLMYHELSHCYCGRDHDYAPGKKYPETEAGRRRQAEKWLKEGGPRPGYWDDGCPVSLMYPVIVDDDCVQAHYNEYVKEIFDRCDPF